MEKLSAQEIVSQLMEFIKVGEISEAIELLAENPINYCQFEKKQEYIGALRHTLVIANNLETTNDETARIIKLGVVHSLRSQCLSGDSWKNNKRVEWYQD